MGVTTIAIISIVASLAGAGVSYYAQNQAANAASQVATLNAQAGLQQATAQGRMQQLTAAVEAARQKALGETAENNAAAIRDQAEIESRVSQENIRKSRAEFDRALAAQRAATAGSGVIEATGSPLDLLVAASQDQQQFETEQRWVDENNRRRGFRQAAIAGMEGKVAGFNADMANISGMAALAEARARGTAARLQGFSDLAQARGAKLSALGGLIGSVGSSAGSYYDWYRNRTPRSTYGVA